MNREQMEQNFRVRLANLLKTQLGLTDDGMRQLSDVNQRFDRQRRELLRREMMTRRGIRDEVLRGDSASAGRIDQLLTDQFKIERERIDLTEAEQRELGKFLTPVQRAKYLGVQEQIRREMDQLRGRGRGMPPWRFRADAFRAQGGHLQREPDGRRAPERGANRVICLGSRPGGGMVDAADSKSTERRPVRVRVSPWAFVIAPRPTVRGALGPELCRVEPEAKVAQGTIVRPHDLESRTQATSTPCASCVLGHCFLRLRCALRPSHHRHTQTPSSRRAGAFVTVRRHVEQRRSPVHPSLSCAEAMREADIVLCTLTDDLSRTTFDMAGDARVRLLANFGVGFNHIDLDVRARGGNHGHQHARSAHRGHRRPARCCSFSRSRGARVKASANCVLASGRVGDRPTCSAHASRAKPLASSGSAALARLSPPGRATDSGCACSTTLVSALTSRRSCRTGATSSASFESLLHESDFVSLHCPATPETRHLMNATTLRAMQRQRIPRQHQLAATSSTRTR